MLRTWIKKLISKSQTMTTYPLTTDSALEDDIDITTDQALDDAEDNVDYIPLNTDRVLDNEDEDEDEDYIPLTTDSSLDGSDVDDIDMTTDQTLEDEDEHENGNNTDFTTDRMLEIETEDEDEDYIPLTSDSSLDSDEDDIDMTIDQALDDEDEDEHENGDDTNFTDRDIGDLVDGVEDDDEMEDASNHRVPSPADRFAIESLKKATYESAISGMQACTVCLEVYNEGEKVTLMPCHHIYHTDCIRTWLQRNNACPVCRFTLPVGH